MKLRFVAAMAVVAFAAFTFTACDKANACNYNESANTLTCQEKTYKTVKTGNKVWMAENLARFDSDSSFCYGSNHENCEKYGRLYPYESANTICPDGWALPSQADFEGVDLKVLNVLNAGYRYASNGKFADEGVSASFWTADSYDDARGTMVRIKDDSISYEHFSKSIAYSVRCIKK
ncbi:major paralogous domain-containing protein [Fibrobacter sp. UWH9]|uniref:FISUMP domain-containing protein n=1 Tax=unclassified Fibrobacter TaxID=2634177 RepID=UPI00091DC289|nr:MULTISPECIES: FISUMP domain-containing protein [Fibrobacter]MCQ2099520.1 hypothetical protein [Fibrobacter sp.]MCL4102599.1 hypothetical protein [Fibrobacter succinogenes]MDO4946278.1 FISUMP domain-containing protein [Fibrobacter sp.]OWV03409.1 hypothetical protein B7993_13355 [Fibrobacter sp. UWH3]OWV10387.1 hypothetical protein B7992_11230 [Fibrobacter sp. UWH1]